MKSTVNVETSVIGYLTSWPSGDLIIAARQKITRDWWRDAPAKYELLVSERVVSEARALAIHRPCKIALPYFSRCPNEG